MEPLPTLRRRAVEPVLDPSDGTIEACSSAGCGYRCCDFSRGNYIVLYPGELNEAIASGASLDHLEFRASHEGGHRAICHACDTSTCDGGYKPLDCASYPYFPTLDADGLTLRTGIVSRKCPLAIGALRRHAARVVDQWRALAERSRDVRRWLQRVSLVDYRPAGAREGAAVQLDSAPSPTGKHESGPRMSAPTEHKSNGRVR